MGIVGSHEGPNRSQRTMNDVRRDAPYRPDAWVLHAVVLAEGEEGASLVRIVAAGDYVNHAVFDARELSTGLGRLLTAGLVHRIADAYVPSTDALDVCSVRGRAEQQRKAAELVAQWSVSAFPLSDDAPSEQACAAAIEAYLAPYERVRRNPG